MHGGGKPHYATLAHGCLQSGLASMTVNQCHGWRLLHIPRPSCSRPARENVMNAHGETRLFLVVVNQPKIQ